MIELPTPNMVLTGADKGLPPYRMTNSRWVAPDVTPYWLANNTAAVAVGFSGSRIKALVINCHGFVSEAGIFEGLDLGTGIEKKDLHHFAQLKKRVDAIYINSCAAARGQQGKAFCAALARYTGARVYAGDRNQKTHVSELQAILKGDVIDDYEGAVWEFGSAGEPRQVTF